MKKLLDSLHSKILKSKFAEEVTEAEIEALVKAKELTNDGWISLPKVAFDRMIARMESESERSYYEEESLFINVRDAARIVREIVREHSNSEIPNKSDDGWIPVSSGKMPETEEPCWITYEDADGKLHVGEDIYCDYGGWYETEDTAVKAWMYVNAPAPYQPKGEK